MKKVLITGGAGFIGSHLCRHWLLQKAKVFCVDNLFSARESNVEELSFYQHFTFIEHDIREPFEIDCDEIYHLACPASPKFYQKNPLSTLETSFLGTKNMLELARKKKIKLFFSSTSEVYGDPLEHPQEESYFGNVNSFGERACYDEGKRVAEALCYSYQQIFKMDIRIGRIFNTYGPKMRIDDGRAVSNFIALALKNKPIKIYGTGKQTRSFCYIEDLIDGIIKLMGSSDVSSPVNLGNPCEVSILELAQMIIKMTDSQSKILFQNSLLDDPQIRKPDISLAQKVFNWNPKIDLNEGLEKTIEDFKRRLDEERCDY